MLLVSLDVGSKVVGPDIEDEEDAAQDFEPDDDGEDDEQIDDGRHLIHFIYSMTFYLSPFVLL